MMVDPTQVMKGIEEDPSLLKELAALGGGDMVEDDPELHGGWVCVCVCERERESWLPLVGGIWWRKMIRSCIVGVGVCIYL
jgi:hypothetical protein